MLRGLDFFSTKTAESQGSSAAQGGEEGQQNRREMSLALSNRYSLCVRYDFKATSKTAQSSIGVRRMQHHIYRETCRQNCTDHNVLGRQGRERAERGKDAGGRQGDGWGGRVGGRTEEEFCRAAARRAPTCPRGAAVERPARPEPELEERKREGRG